MVFPKLHRCSGDGKVFLPHVSIEPNMEAAAARDVLIKVLGEIQSSSGLACPKLSGTTRPIEDLPEFDSKIWPVATAQVATAIGIALPDDLNIFREEHSHRALTIDQSVAVIMKAAKGAHPEAKVA